MLFRRAPTSPDALVLYLTSVSSLWLLCFGWRILTGESSRSNNETYEDNGCNGLLPFLWDRREEKNIQPEFGLLLIGARGNAIKLTNCCPDSLANEPVQILMLRRSPYGDNVYAHAVHQQSFHVMFDFVEL